MPHVRIAVDRIRPGSVEMVVRKVREGLLPLLRQQPGFVAYDVVATGDDEAVFISTWESRQAAEGSIGLAATWVRENLAELIVSVENHVGELRYSTR